MYRPLVPPQTALVIEGQFALIAHIVFYLLVNLPDVNIERYLTVGLVGALVTLEVLHPFVYALHVFLQGFI